jgi:riboflavin biosynthesis pyrimidine reductase
VLPDPTTTDATATDPGSPVGPLPTAPDNATGPRPSAPGAVDGVGVRPLPTGPGADDALAALYAWPERTAVPYLRAIMIASLDGGCTFDGRAAGLGNAADTHLFAVLRDLAEVILVGAGTVRAEGYAGVRLDAVSLARRQRWGLPATPPPIAVVTGRGLDPRSPLFVDTVTPPIVITTEVAAKAVPKGIEVIISGHDRVNLEKAVTALGVAGFGRIHCEGGPALLGDLAIANLVDECCLTIAPMLVGSRSTRLLPIPLSDAVRWELAMARIDGSHLFTRYRRTAG